MLRHSISFFSSSHTVLRTSTTKKLWGLRDQMRTKQLELAKKRLENPLIAATNPAQEQAQLTTRTPKDAALSITIPLGKDPEVRSEYINPVGGLRFGKLLEDLDAFACTIGFNQAYDFEKIGMGITDGPSALVTATIERIDLYDRVRLDMDLKMTGRVTWVGNASMCVRCDLLDVTNTNSNSEEGKKLLHCNFILVTVNEKGRPIACNPLLPETKQEKKDFEEAEKANNERRTKRKAMKKANSQIVYDLQKLALNDATLDLIRTKCAAASDISNDNSPSTAIPMRQTVQVATHLSQPQDANTSKKIFGGYLLQKAFEIAWVAAYTHFRSRRPKFVCSDDVEFHSPVSAGSICIFTATVTYVRQPHLATISVRCEIMVDDHNHEAPLGKKLTNTFEFVFTPEREDDAPTEESLKKGEYIVPDVICESYEDWVRYATGKAVIDDAIEYGKSSGGLRINELL